MCRGFGYIAIAVPQPFFAFTPVPVTLALARCISSIMAAPPRHDDPAYFQKRCEDMSLPSGLLDTLVDKGFNSMALLAFAVPDSDSLEHFIVSIVGRPLGSDPSAPLLTADAAALRRLYHLCKTECAGIGLSTPASILPTASGKKALSKEEIAELMQKIMKAYPSELVRADIMPSSPFLMVVTIWMLGGSPGSPGDLLEFIYGNVCTVACSIPHLWRAQGYGMYNACDRAAPFGSRVKKRDRLGLYCLTW